MPAHTDSHNLAPVVPISARANDSRPVRVHRAAKSREFVSMSNALAGDDRLSYGARGLLLKVLSLHPTYEHAVERLATDVDGQSAVRAMLGELEEIGHARTFQDHGLRGRIQWRWEFSEEPKSDWVEQTKARKSKNGCTIPRLSRDGKPSDGKSGDSVIRTTTIRTTERRLSEQQPPAAAALCLPGLDVETANTEAGERPSKAKDQQRPRSPLFDALAVACGNNLAEMTERANRACGVALAEIRKVCPGVTPGEIHRRADNFRRMNRPGYRLTPSKFASDWSTLGDSSASNSTATPYRGSSAATLQ